MKPRKSKVNLLLTELLITVMFFIVSSGICLNIFAKAQNMSRESSKLNAAMIKVSSCAELIRAYNGDLLKVSRAIGASPKEQHYEVLYDKDWNESCASDSVYTLELQHLGTTDGLLYVKISVFGSDELIYLTEIVYYIREGVDYEK